MAKVIKFHLDESVPQFTSLAAALRKTGLDVTTVHDANLYAADDVDHMSFCRDHQRVVFTNDEDYLVLANEITDHHGVIYCRQNKYSIGELVAMLRLIWEAYDDAYFVNRVEFL